ncbi:hypothetical protein EYF80_003580 [Liparis tanakae]|uniref:Uncharacterized protein n=1 Tax=Liparis tanakae TaxID=230148 RepID=A0A4Z2J926_9TELE|nr:hypothetical protein EYF80_003580 [Liparis tanakae]
MKCAIDPRRDGNTVTGSESDRRDRAGAARSRGRGLLSSSVCASCIWHCVSSPPAPTVTSISLWTITASPSPPDSPLSCSSIAPTACSIGAGLISMTVCSWPASASCSTSCCCCCTSTVPSTSRPSKGAISEPPACWLRCSSSTGLSTAPSWLESCTAVPTSVRPEDGCRVMVSALPSPRVKSCEPAGSRVTVLDDWPREPMGRPAMVKG